MAKQLAFSVPLIDRRQEAAPTPAAQAARRSGFGWHLLSANGVVIGAGAGFALGLLLWGFITLSVLGAVDGLLDHSAEGPTVAQAAETEALNCADFGAVRALSAEDEARFQAQCGAAAPVSNIAPTTMPAAPVSVSQSPAAIPGNRANCDQIRGTSYLSGDERTWYLANCVQR